MKKIIETWWKHYTAWSFRHFSKFLEQLFVKESRKLAAEKINNPRRARHNEAKDCSAPLSGKPTAASSTIPDGGLVLKPVKYLVEVSRKRTSYKLYLSLPLEPISTFEERIDRKI